eukprot:GCRY01001476.1.p1 GENE.GCRY01001476.1~~GCRY01001476.1.p1  ORF type:complete len:164 (+),score=21.34 GCRY01001476.1:83-574(+)
MDSLTNFIDAKKVEVLNSVDDVSTLLENTGKTLKSDCDEQLILNITFTQPIKLKAIQMAAPEDTAPETIKLYCNQGALNFDNVLDLTPTETLTLNDVPTHLGNLGQEPGLFKLEKYVRFQNVRTLTIFIEDNCDGGELTEISQLVLLGMPKDSFDMKNFKPVG